MNELIRTQLNKCQIALIPEIEEGQCSIVIPKGSSSVIGPYDLGKCYLVQFADHILHPSPDSTLASNWNQGRIPKHSYYKVEVVQMMAKMVRLAGFGYIPETNTDTNDFWDGWVPQPSVKIISLLK